MKLELSVRDGGTGKKIPLGEIDISVSDPRYSYLIEVLAHRITLLLEEDFNQLRKELGMDTVFVKKEGE